MNADFDLESEFMRSLFSSKEDMALKIASLAANLPA